MHHHMIIGDSWNFWSNLWSAIWAIASIWTLVFASIVYRKTNKMILDRYLNEDIKVDCFQNLTFPNDYINKDYNNINVSIKKWTYDFYIREINKEDKKYRIWSLLCPIGWGDDDEGFYLNSGTFIYKILTIRDLSKHTNLNKKYEIFKK